MQNSKRIFLIRHAESSHNRNGNLLSGITDVSLTDFGIEQCKRLRKLFEHLPVDKVYSSPLSRAMTSARLIFPEKETIALDNLREINYGIYEGYNTRDISSDDILMKWESSPGNLSFPKGDNVYDYSQNYYYNLLDVVDQSDDDFLVFFSHRTGIRLFIATVLGIDLNKFRKIPCSNCSISEFLYNSESRFQLCAVNVKLIEFM